MLRYYHYRRLSKPSQDAYKIIVLALKKFSSCAVIKRVGNLKAVLDAVKNDNPHLFYINWYSVLYRVEFQADKILIYFNYHTGRRDSIRMWNEARRIAPSLRGATDYETVKNVHDYIASHTKYDSEVTDKGGFRMNDHNMLGPLLDGLGVCEGIARAAQFLLRELRVECTYVSGYVDDNTVGVKGYHAWNLVLINGKVLKMDVTWDLADGCGRVSYDYFCIAA